MCILYWLEMNESKKKICLALFSINNLNFLADVYFAASKFPFIVLNDSLRLCIFKFFFHKWFIIAFRVSNKILLNQKKAFIFLSFILKMDSKLKFNINVSFFCSFFSHTMCIIFISCRWVWDYLWQKMINTLNYFILVCLEHVMRWYSYRP